MKKKILVLLFFILQLSCFHNVVTLADSPKNYLKGKFYNSVQNHFLIATEKMEDSRFKKTVIVILESDEKGAWGLTINKPLGSLPLNLLIDTSLDSEKKESEEFYKVKIPVFWGGPVDKNKIFILHSNEYKNDSTTNFGKISLSNNYQVLYDIVKHKGPKKRLVIVGYSGWGDGQLEGEMERDRWILSDIDIDIIFKEKSKSKWEQAYKKSFIKI